MRYKSSAQVLMILLKKVPDASKVERLLKSDNLQFLLQQYGTSESEMKQRLAGGAFPEELLLELLAQEPDADRLLAQISEKSPVPIHRETINHLLFRQDQPISSDMGIEAQSVTVSDNMLSIGKYLFYAAILIVYVTSVLPEIYKTQSREANIFVALIGGALAGALVHRASNSYWEKFALGIVWSLGTLGVTLLYLDLMGSRTLMFNLESFIPMLIGSIPALACYYFLFSRAQSQ